MRNVLRAGLIWVCLSGPGEAQSFDCPHVALIEDLAQRIMTQRADLSDLLTRRYGSRAAYVFLRYQAQQPTDWGLNLLASMEQPHPPRYLEQVQAAYAISRLGVDQGLAAVGQSVETALTEGGWNVWAAMIRAEGGAGFYLRVAVFRAGSGDVAKFEEQYRLGYGLAPLLLLFSDDDLLELATAAEAAGDLAAVVMALSARRDLTEYLNLIERHRDDPLVSSIDPAMLGLTARYHATIPPRPSGPDNSGMRAAIYDVVRATMHVGEMDYLTILLNQTGAFDEVSAAARAFMASDLATTQQDFDRLERVWTFLLRELAIQMPMDQLNQHLSSFSMPVYTRHYADTARETLDWMLAVVALRAYLTGTTDELPERPMEMSEAFDWPNWLALADRIKAGELSDVVQEETTIIAELMLAAGDFDAAIKIAQDQMATKDRLPFFRDVMLRLDRACRGVTVVPGQGFLLGGGVIYDFP
ncbi:MAG: hypothetical protein AB3N23_03100 [Paracoccaceae bacterium]